MRHRTFVLALLATLLAGPLSVAPPSLFAQTTTPTAATQSRDAVTIDTKASTTPFPHFWEQMFGSGRANLSLRESYRRDMREVKQATGFSYVRFHAIFQDENGVYDEDKDGKPLYNFSYVDQIYDGLLENGVRPFVEISFTPKKMATRLDYHAFWYKQIVAPPDYAKWDPLVTAFAKHLIDRYGIEEVSKWYFEVWNEPNIDFWTGRPAQQTYFDLYDHTARALKAVSEKIRVGGPATAQAAWVDAMIAHAAQDNVPLDFVSTHVYGNDVSNDVFGKQVEIAPHQMVCAAAKKVHEQIKASARPDMPLFWTEYNATYMNERAITDSIYMGPWMASTLRQCDGLTAMMSYWTFSDVFEEQGVVKTPFYGGYGLIAQPGIPKPAFDVFKLLHGLGTERIASDRDDLLVTRRQDGTIVVAAWNLVEPNATGTTKTIKLSFRGMSQSAAAHIWRVDASHGNTLGAWEKMGEPKNPTPAQVKDLRKASETGPAETRKLDHGVLTLDLPPSGLAVIDLK